ncbi:MAG: hypothetical protein QF921_15415 [Pseudomonadales bacterium]|jgi:hypothetical protein|nr:hypothetical protein [Pseudomonadales bacterium]MDP6472760.1 hypothetical protein [Pseudomonadales bacterium]MDP6827973.1 hypothetical protein [Pseudomonadales bacterium]MDP6972872.1 hypothetical protein [Pseudomonadales bacterium]|tara:strand:- start:905 stop:1138 length:234 start_codon:yes stop_codon:yes gene_type:complete
MPTPVDNNIAQCNRLPIVATDEYGNTYQQRESDDGETYRVLKNFPTCTELPHLTASLGTEHEYLQLEHFWLLSYRAA